jgi:hypothetical protein
MSFEFADIDLSLKWNRTKDQLKVSVNDLVLFNSVTGLVSPQLSARQVKWITEHYEQKRMKYVFA